MGPLVLRFPTPPKNMPNPIRFPLGMKKYVNVLGALKRLHMDEGMNEFQDPFHVHINNIITISFIHSTAGLT